MRHAFCGADVFDGAQIVPDAVLLVRDGRVEDILGQVPAGVAETRLPGGTLSPGFLDLQVNGGGGEMVGAATDANALVRLCTLHGRLGATGILPTLITDTAEVTRQVIDAGCAVAGAGVPGFLGLHLEGPHLDPRRKGAHDPDLIRPMTDADLNTLCAAAHDLPALMVTLAPSAAQPEQIRQLADAGAIVSLGHSDATLAEARRAIEAGANCATHLFNAMSQLGNREPGMVGAVLNSGIFAGLIADGHHVAIETLRIALSAQPHGLFLVSDCMAAAGSDATEFRLGGRRILRQGGLLTLEDGTLAGADLTMAMAVKTMSTRVGLPLHQALAMATSTPAALVRRSDIGGLLSGQRADLVHLDAAMTLSGVWRAGVRIA